MANVDKKEGADARSQDRELVVGSSCLSHGEEVLLLWRPTLPPPPQLQPPQDCHRYCTLFLPPTAVTSVKESPETLKPYFQVVPNVGSDAFYIKSPDTTRQCEIS